MNLGDLLHSFAVGQEFQTVAALIVVDFVLGVAAAVKMGTFALSYVSNFARNDVLAKVVPFFVLNSAALVAGKTDIVIPGFDLNIVKDAMFATVTAAMVGSLVSSLSDLGFTALPGQLGRGGAARPPESL
jgi:hypothetical protein